MQVLASIIALLLTYSGFRAAMWLWGWFLIKAGKEHLNFKHRKNGQAKKDKKA